MDKILERFREVKSLKIRKNIFKLIMIFVGFLVGILSIRFELEITNFIIRNTGEDIEILIICVGFILFFYSIGQAIILMVKFFSEGYSFKGKMIGININEKSKMEKIHSKLEKDKSPIIITEDYLIVFNSDVISIDKIEDINLKVYKKKLGYSTGYYGGTLRGNLAGGLVVIILFKLFVLPYKMLALNVKLKGKYAGEITVDICRPRYIDEIGKREIENKVEKLKEVIKTSEVL